MRETTDSELIHAARAMYADGDDIQIDADAKISRGDNRGAYVQAWVWVDFRDIEDASR
jgi:hypothetical protein